MSKDPKKPRKRYPESPKSREKRIARQRVWYRSHKKEAGEVARRWRLRTVYGLSPQDFADMVRQQDRKCFVCHKKPRKPLFIDHCHKTGRVRALLCVRCNSMLGFAGDDPIVMLSGASYSIEFRGAKRPVVVLPMLLPSVPVLREPHRATIGVSTLGRSRRILGLDLSRGYNLH
jgi:hypothetical protein